MQTFVKNTVGMENGGPRKVSPFFIPMMIGNMASGQIAIEYGLKGDNFAVASACAELSGVDSFGAVPDCSDWLAWLVWLVWLIWLDWLGWLPGDVTFPVQPVIRNSADSIAILFFI